MRARALRCSLAMAGCVLLLAVAEGRPADSYPFPIVPGTPAWRALESHDAMIAATQVPPGILSTMSTAGVVETCLTHPLLIDLWLANTPQGGFDGATRWNVVQELLARPDAGQELLARYAALDVPPAATLHDHSALARAIAEMELIVAQQPILRSMTRAQRFDLLRAAVRMADAKTRHLDSSHLEYTALLAARTLEEDDLLTRGAARSPSERLRVRAFLRSGFGADEALVERVVDLARKTTEAPQPAAAPSPRMDVELRFQRPSQWPSDRPIRRPLTLSLVNRGADPVFVSPAMGEIAERSRS